MNARRGSRASCQCDRDFYLGGHQRHGGREGFVRTWLLRMARACALLKAIDRRVPWERPSTTTSRLAATSDCPISSGRIHPPGGATLTTRRSAATGTLRQRGEGRTGWRHAMQTGEAERWREGTATAWRRCPSGCSS